MPYVPSRLRPAIALLACASALLLIGCEDANGNSPAPDSGTVTFVEGLPVVISVRAVCRLASDTPGAAAARITGADGSQSVVAGGRSYWFFGDTIRTIGQQQDVIPAAVATTQDLDARDCLDLQFKTADGSVTPMFPRLEETTAWPDGVLALDDGSIFFYMVKAVRTSPFAWHVGSVGLGRIPPGSVEGERLAEAIWKDEHDFGVRVVGVRSPVRVGDDVIVYITTADRLNYAAKAPLSRIAERDAYNYWDGDTWSPNPSRAQPMWKDPPDPYDFPADNGVQVSFDDRIGKWIAVYNSKMASTEVRVADDPWGPWSEPVPWFDCRPLVLDRYPYCYTGELHRQLTRDNGDTMYMTISSQDPYDVTLLELHMATAIHEWHDAAADVTHYAAASPGPSYEDNGVKFYASLKPAPGLAPVYARADGAYTFEQRVADATPAFYAYTSPPDGPVATVSVVETGDGAARRLVAGGDGDAVFYVPCVRQSCEESAAAP
jgi:hypothetical protein